MKKVYEAWVKDGDGTLALAKNIEDLRSVCDVSGMA
jgi:hypothetical protein